MTGQSVDVCVVGHARFETGQAYGDRTARIYRLHADIDGAGSGLHEDGDVGRCGQAHPTGIAVGDPELGADPFRRPRYRRTIQSRGQTEPRGEQKNHQKQNHTAFFHHFFPPDHEIIAPSTGLLSPAGTDTLPRQSTIVDGNRLLSLHIFEIRRGTIRPVQVNVK